MIKKKITFGVPDGEIRKVKCFKMSSLLINNY